MPVLIAAFTLLPLLVGAVAEYLACRLPRRRIWRLAPPAAGVLVAAIISVARWRIWTSQEVSPLTQILIFPILPAAFLLVGMLVGYRIWRHMWSPRVVEDK